MLRIGTAHWCVALLALTLVAYLPLWHNGFVDFDDELYITTNPQVIQGLTWPGFRWAWTNCHAKYWQPLSWLSLQLDASLFSTDSPDGQRLLSPAAFHGQNLFWHVASVLFLFALWQRLTGARWLSFLVAALFAVHPMHVESVAWATERKDVLSVFFGILTLWAYLRYLEKPGWKRYLGIAAAFSLSLLSKPMLLTLPFVMLLLDYWPLRRMVPGTLPPETAGQPPLASVPLRRLVAEKAPLFLLALGIGIVTLAARELSGAAVSLRALPLSARLANAVMGYCWYLSSTYYPLQLAVFYPHPHRNWSILVVLAATATLLAITLLSWGQARQRPWLMVGWLWFAGTLVPVIGLAQGGEQAWADRFSYWPHIGLFVATVWGLAELVGRFRVPALVAGTVGALVLGCLGVLTWVQAGYWRDTATLWERALAATKDNDRAHLNLGKYYMDQRRPDQAAAHFAESVRIEPNSPDGQHLLGIALLSLGQLEKAADHFRETLVRDPKYTNAWYNLGVTRLRQGMADGAIRCFRRVLELEPGSADALAGTGLALWRQGKRQEASQAFQAALRQNPTNAEAWHGLGVAHLVQGDSVQAIEAFAAALRSNPRLVKAYSDLGLAYGRQGQWSQAASCYLTAVQLQDQGEKSLQEMNGRVSTPDAVLDGVMIRCRLALVLNQLGHSQGAIEVYRAALERDPDWPRKFTAKAWGLATDPDVNLRDPRLACELARAAVEAVAEPSASLLDTLAAAHAALEEFPKAVETAQQALNKAMATGDTTLAKAIRDRLQLYQKRRSS
jgi:tetratricopeptide (TPR) repeat protein